MSDKVDMFELLRHIDKKDIGFYDSLTDEQKKSVVPLLAMRWLSSGTANQTQLLNTVANPLVFRMYKHPALLYKLLVACSDGKERRYKWIKKKSKDKSSPVSVEVISLYYGCSKKDAIRYKKRLTLDDVIDMADSLGYDKEKVQKIKAEFK